MTVDVMVGYFRETDVALLPRRRCPLPHGQSAERAQGVLQAVCGCRKRAATGASDPRCRLCTVDTGLSGLSVPACLASP